MTEQVQSQPAGPVDQMISEALASYSPADAAIAEMAKRFLPMKIAGVEDKDGLKQVHAARMVVKSHRCAIENKRVELNADALKYQRSVNSEARRLTALLVPIEEHLAEEENRALLEKARLKSEAEAARKRLIDERVAALAAVGYQAVPSSVDAMSDEDYAAVLAGAEQAYAERQAREAEEAARRAAEEAKAAEARRIEAERMAAERAELERQRAEQKAAEEKAATDLRAEQERLAAERRAQEEEIARQRAAIEADRARVEQERLRMEREKELERARAEAAAKAKAEAEADARRQEEARIAREKAEAEAAARREAAKPEAEKLLAMAAHLEGWDLPELPTTGAWARVLIDDLAGLFREKAEELTA